MKYRKWDPKLKSKIVLEGLNGSVPLSEICVKYQIAQAQYYRWLGEFEKQGYRAFETTKNVKKEQKLNSEITKLKRIIAELSIDLKKTELELNAGDEQ